MYRISKIPSVFKINKTTYHGLELLRAAFQRAIPFQTADHKIKNQNKIDKPKIDPDDQFSNVKFSI